MEFQGSSFSATAPKVKMFPCSLKNKHMPRYTPHQAFITYINGGYPLVSNEGWVLNGDGEQVVGLELDVAFEVGHPKSKKLHMYISKRQLLELRGILNSAIDDLYEGVDMSSTFSSDLK